MDAKKWIETIEAENSPRENDIYPQLKQWIADNNPSTVLDIGCGQGICADKIKSTTLKYTGVDTSKELLARAKELYSSPNNQFIHSDVYLLPFENESFDAAFSITVWHLIEDIHKAGKELTRVLKKNGHFFIITANPEAYEEWKTIATAADKLYFHSLQNLLDSLQNAGLQIEKTETFRVSEAAKNLFISFRGLKP